MILEVLRIRENLSVTENTGTVLREYTIAVEETRVVKHLMCYFLHIEHVNSTSVTEYTHPTNPLRLLISLN